MHVTPKHKWHKYLDGAKANNEIVSRIHADILNGLLSQRQAFDIADDLYVDDCLVEMICQFEAEQNEKRREKTGP